LVNFRKLVTISDGKKLIKVIVTLLIMAVLSIILVFSAHLVLCQDIEKTCLWMIDMCEIALFEWVVINSLFWLLYGLLGRLYAGNLIIGILYILLTMISYYKLLINGTPLLISDFRMAGQFMEIAGFALPQIKFSSQTWLAVAIPIIITIALFIFEKYIKPKGIRKIILPVSFVMIGIFVFTPLFSHWAVSIDDPDKFQEQRVVEYGPFMGMYCTYAQGKSAGEIYDKEAILRVKKQLPKTSAALAEENRTPTVIFLMSESFFDVAKLDNVTFKPDPIPNFHKITKQFQSGEFISSAYCGGTGYVEMEVMTGLCGNLLKDGDTLTYLTKDDVYEKIPSISDVFKNYGYKTVFIHSYNSQLYNRKKIYTDFGFDEVLFEDSFQSPEYRGGYISDMDLSEKIISVYEEKGDKDLFLYAISMENHQPYPENKFEKSDIKIITDHLDEREKSVFGSYITGISDADKALGSLIRYFKGKKDPVMLVFFGDHMPNLKLDEEENVFTKLGYVEGMDSTKWNSTDLKKMLSTDYVVWTNYKDTDYADTPQSSLFLGVSVLKRLGLNLTDYYTWLSNRIMPNLLMYRSRLFVDENNIETKKVPEKDREMIEDYSVAIYDIIYGDNCIFNVEH